MNSVDELEATLGRSLSRFSDVREVRYFHEEDREGYLRPVVELTLAAEDGSKALVSLRAHGVQNFRAQLSGSPSQVMGLEIESIRDRQWEGLNWELHDYEDERLEFLCRDIEVVSVGTLPP